MLVGAARAGEPITDARLARRARSGAGPGLGGGAGAARRSGRRRPARPRAAGSTWSGADDATGAPVVLAPDAAVLAVLPAEDGPTGASGRLILVAMPRELATRVAAASVAEGLAVTLR